MSALDDFLADLEEEQRVEEKDESSSLLESNTLLNSTEAFTPMLKQGHNDNVKLIDHLNKIEHFKRLHSAEQLNETEYEYIVETNNLLIHIDHEIQNIFKKVRDLYAQKFPGLESHVLNPLDYARVVKRIGHQTDLSAVDMTDILPSSVIMIVRVTASSSLFRQKDDQESKMIVDRSIQGSDEILKLDELKQQMLTYVSSRMNALAPNLSAIVGTTIAAQLIGIAGGLEALSKIPAADVQLLGKEKKNQFIGTMSASTNNQLDVKYLGYISNCDLIYQTPPYLRKKIGRQIALKCTLAARVDLCQSSPDGSAGKEFRDQIENSLRKLQEPPPGKQLKPIPAPDEKKKKTRRGGSKSRRLKEMTKVSELQKKRNRLAFGTEAEEEFGQEYGSSSGMGMIGIDGSIRQTKKTLKASTNSAGGKSTVGGSATYSGTATQLRTGLASSLAFTPVQGIALENPLNAQKRLNPTTTTNDKKRYFSTTSFFKEPATKKAKTTHNPAT